ncbi:MAG: hypothetical protein P8Y04_05655, partial [Desulfobulbaceae bacterium]
APATAPGAVGNDGKVVGFRREGVGICIHAAPGRVGQVDLAAFEASGNKSAKGHFDLTIFKNGAIFMAAVFK